MSKTKIAIDVNLQRHCRFCLKWVSFLPFPIVLSSYLNTVKSLFLGSTFLSFPFFYSPLQIMVVVGRGVLIPFHQADAFRSQLIMEKRWFCFTAYNTLYD